MTITCSISELLSVIEKSFKMGMEHNPIKDYMDDTEIPSHLAIIFFDFIGSQINYLD